MTTRVHLCGDCSTEAEKSGAIDIGASSSVVIPYGTSCETPAHASIIAATHVLEVPDGVALSVGPDAAPPVTSLSLADVPTTIGPLTHLAAQFLAAWSRGDEQKADTNAITHSVKVAHKLLAETGGR